MKQVISNYIYENSDRIEREINRKIRAQYSDEGYIGCYIDNVVFSDIVNPGRVVLGFKKQVVDIADQLRPSHFYDYEVKDDVSYIVMSVIAETLGGEVIAHKGYAFYEQDFTTFRREDEAEMWVHGRVSYDKERFISDDEAQQ